MTADLFVPPAAEGLPLAALDSATTGADRLDAAALTPTGRNFLAHALVQLARDGWLRTEPGEGFEPVQDHETPEPQPAASAVVSPPTDRAVCDCEAEVHMGVGFYHQPQCATRRAAVLPELADRAAGLREAAEVAESFDIDASPQAVAAELRRMAVETHNTGTQQQCPEREPLIGVRCSKEAGHEVHSDRPGRIWYPVPDGDEEQQQPDTEAQPFRGDQFEQWLKGRRDEHGWQGSNDRRLYDALDIVLDRYRLHADTGTPLGEHVCERASSLEECDCLEPAPVAQQPAAEAWDVPDARPGTTDYTRQQQAAAADGEEPSRG